MLSITSPLVTSWSLPPTPITTEAITTAITLATCATEAFGQCAGRGMASEECCPAEYKCVEQTKFYSSCLPKYSPPSPPPAPPPVPAGQCPTLKYAQCDGDGIATTLCCPAEFKCAKIAKEGVSFSQCIPEHVPPPSPSPPPSPPPVPAGQCVTLKYGQCAGRGMTSEACCPAEFKCVAQTKFFSQCLPKRSPPSPPPSPPPVPAGQCPTLKYSQCGGEGIASTLCCPTGSSCVEKTPFFSQCLPPTCMGGELSVCVARCAETAATYQKCVETCLAHC